MRKDIVDRFERYVFPEPNSGCWLWDGGYTNQGYGAMWVDGKTIGAHRVSFEIYKGDSTGKVILHKCDNKACVNPNHLMSGTHDDNSKDMVRKGRQATGERCGNSKLTKETVIEIRNSGLSSKELSRKFGISKTNVKDIKNNKIWKGVS